MNKEGNTYTIVYASVLAIFAAVLLAFTSQALSEKQKRNETVDKMIQILRSVNVTATNANAQQTYEKLIKESYVVNNKGEKIEGDAFSINLAKELEKPKDESHYPVFVANIDGSDKYILALRGTGLWGPLWGYISLESDKNTIFGADFSHEGETPGLGSEISTPHFSDQFKGKHLFKDGKFVGVAVVKPGTLVTGKEAVDGISGGTITSHAVEHMLDHTLEGYVGFLKKE